MISCYSYGKYKTFESNYFLVPRDWIITPTFANISCLDIICMQSKNKKENSKAVAYHKNINLKKPFLPIHLKIKFDQTVPL